MSEMRTDVAIIGAGPVGLFAVFECGMLKMRCHVVDALDMAGGQCAALYPEKPIYDIPGHPRIDAIDLVERLKEQAAPFAPTYHLGARVETLAQRGDDWELVTSRGDRIVARAVIVAAGVGAFGPNRPPVARLAEFERDCVHYLVKRREDFRGKRLVIAGGGDSALDWTLNLQPIVRSLTLVHRRDAFKAAPASVNRMKELVMEGKINFLLGQIGKLDGADGQIDHVHLTMDAGDLSIPATRLLPFFGLTMKLGPVADWGLELNDNLISVDTEKFQTSVPGVFAIGDINHYPGKLKLILSGFHEAALMAQAAKSVVAPGERVVFQYTTSSTKLQKKLGVA